MAVEGLMAHGPPALPKWFFFLSIAIIVLSFGAFIAAAVNVSSFDSWSYYAGSSGPGGFMIFDAIFTWIVLGTMIAFERWVTQFYIRLTYVVLLPLTAIFWLSAWAWAASVASVFSGYNNSFWGSELKRYSASMAACAALGAFTWVAVVVLTIFYVLACLRDGGDTVNQTEMGMQSKTEPAPAAAAAAPDAGATGFNQQTQDYYGGQPPAQHEVYPQQAPHAAQEMSSPNQYQQPQQNAPYPADNTTPYPNDQAPRH